MPDWTKIGVTHGKSDSSATTENNWSRDRVCLHTGNRLRIRHTLWHDSDEIRFTGSRDRFGAVHLWQDIR